MISPGSLAWAAEMAQHGGNISPDMPLLLALETTGMCGSVALVADGHCVGEFTLQSNVTHSRRLLGSIDRLFAQAGCDWDRVGGIAVSLGPGSFTGIRIGLSTANGLAMATGLPLVGVSTLDGVAGQFAYLEKPLCIVLDARKKEVYAAFYQCLGDGSIKRSSDYLVMPPEQLAARISEPTVMAGDGAVLYRDLFVNVLGDKALLVDGATCFPRAASVGKMAWSAWHRNEFLEPSLLSPLYVRASDAELNFSRPS